MSVMVDRGRMTSCTAFCRSSGSTLSRPSSAAEALATLTANSSARWPCGSGGCGGERWHISSEQEASQNPLSTHPTFTNQKHRASQAARSAPRTCTPPRRASSTRYLACFSPRNTSWRYSRANTICGRQAGRQQHSRPNGGDGVERGAGYPNALVACSPNSYTSDPTPEPTPHTQPGLHPPACAARRSCPPPLTAPQWARPGSAWPPPQR